MPKPAPPTFRRPLSQKQAQQNIDELLAAPRCRVLPEEEGFWDRRVAAEVPTRGNLVPDVHLPALLLQHGIVTLYTHDSDIRKLSFLKFRDPGG